MSDPDMSDPFSELQSLEYTEYTDGYNYALTQLMPTLELETVLFGMLTMALIVVCYQNLRAGIRPLTKQAKGRLLRLAIVVSLYVPYMVHWALSIHHAGNLFFGHWIGYDVLQSSLSAPLSLYPIFGPFILETVVFGMFNTLVMYAVYVFIDTGSHTRSQKIMLSVALFMYTISLSHWALQARLIAVNFTLAAGAGPDFVDPGVAPLVLISINVVFSDAIILWRLCVFWRRSSRMYVLAGGLLALTIALNIANVAVEAHLFLSTGDRANDVSTAAQPAFSDSACGTVSLALSLATNVISTVAIGWKTWRHRRRIAEHLSATSYRSSIVDTVMVLLWESGCLYCIIWILYIISSKSAAFDIVNSELKASSPFPSRSADYFNRLMAQLTGIYPTIILVLVALEQSHLDRAYSAPSLSTLVNTPLHSGTKSGTLSQALSLPYLTRPFVSTLEGDVEGGDAHCGNDAGKAVAALEDTGRHSPILSAAKATRRETVHSIDRGSRFEKERASLRRLYPDAARLLSSSVEIEPSPLPHANINDGTQMPTLVALTPSRRPLSLSSTLESRVAPLEMRSAGVADGEAHAAMARIGQTRHTGELAPLSPNRRAPSPLLF